MVFRCLGLLKNVESEILLNQIETIIPNIKGKPRIFGFDVEVDSDELCFSINTLDEIEYQIDIVLTNEAKFFKILEELRNMLIEVNGTFDLVYFKEDDNGNQITKDETFFTNFD